MIDFLADIDQTLFLFLNGLHNDAWDQLMFWISKKSVWYPLYALFLLVIIRLYRWQALWILIGVGLLITLSDQLSVHLFKEVFQRPRPCHEPALDGLVHIVNGKCGGSWGFVSSHAANSFALAVYLIHFLAKKSKYFLPLLLFWAALVSYSRIYLGVHYPGDVICGALLGWLLAVICARLVDFAMKKSKTKA